MLAPGAIWCALCKSVRQTGGAWTDAAEAFAGVTLLCAGCYDKARAWNLPS